MFLDKEKTGLWLIDIQENLFPLIDRSCEILQKICVCLAFAKTSKLPVFVTEQYPKGLGHTVAPIKEKLPENQPIFTKTTFSGYHDPEIKKAIDVIPVETWILTGIETHICVLQTAKDLILAGKKVVILNDATSSRSLFDFSTALAELREMGCRISSTETVIYEMLRDANSADFKAILPLLKAS